MNKVALVGRLTRDVETNTTQAGKTVARFSVAVSRKFKNEEGNYDADFINCVAFNRTADFISKYFAKGMAIGITGRIQTGNYTNKDGQKVYTTDVIVDEAEFVESKHANGNAPVSDGDISNFVPTEDGNTPDADISHVIPMEGEDDLELPFN